MSKIFQIVDNECRWETPFEYIEQTYEYPRECIFVVAPDYVQEGWFYDDTLEGDARFVHPEPEEGWAFDEEDHVFYCIADVPKVLKAAQEVKQNENKMGLAEFLDNHPITWKDGKQYGVTMEDQSEIQLNISQYQVQLKAGVPDPVLEWHAIHEACKPWTIEDLSELVLAISNFVYPWFQKMNAYKEQIFSEQNRKVVEKMTFDYRTEEEIAADIAAEEERKKKEAAEKNKVTPEDQPVQA